MSKKLILNPKTKRFIKYGGTTHRKLIRNGDMDTVLYYGENNSLDYETSIDQRMISKGFKKTQKRISKKILKKNKVILENDEEDKKMKKELMELQKRLTFLINN